MFQIIPGVILLAHFAVLTSCDPENVTDSKPKRGIYEFGNAGAYHVLPLQQLESLNQASFPSQAETPIVDLTYKPSEINVQEDNQHLLVYIDKPKTLAGQLKYPSEITGQENKPIISVLSDKPGFSNNPNSNIGESATQANSQYVPAFNGHKTPPNRDAIQNQPQDPTASAVQSNTRYIPTYTDRPRLLQNSNHFNGQNINQLQGFNPNNPQHLHAAQQQQAQHLNFQNVLRQQQLKNTPQNLHFQNQPQQVIGPQVFVNPASQYPIHFQHQQQGQQLNYPDALRQKQLNTPQNTYLLNAIKQQQIDGLQQLNFHNAANQQQIINPQQLYFQHAANQQPINVQQPASYHYPIVHPVQAKPLTLHSGQQFNNIHAGNLRATPSIQNKPNPNRAQSQSIPQQNRPLINPAKQQNNQHQHAQNNNLQRPQHKPQAYQSPPALLAQITDNFNAIEPSFSSPQSFENPIITQSQHSPRLPLVRKPQTNYNKPVQSTPTSQENADDETDEEDNESERSEDDDESSEENTEEDTAITDEERQRQFEAGYKEAAKGFPAYHQEDNFKQFDDDDENEQSGSGVEEYRPARYEDYHSDDEEGHDPDPDHDHEAYFSEQEYEKNKFYADNGVDGSQHHDKKQQQGKERDSTAHSHPSKPNHSHKKLHKSSYSSKTKHPAQTNKNYKPLVQQKPPSDPRHVGTAPRKQVFKTAHPKAPVRTEAVLTAPKYEYGFEPIKSPKSQHQKGVISDSEGRHSSVYPKYIVVKQDWKISKFSETN